MNIPNMISMVRILLTPVFAVLYVRGALWQAMGVLLLCAVSDVLDGAIPRRFNMVTDQSQSMLAVLGGLIAPVFAPLGFGDWRTSTALVCGLVAKESVISTLTVLLGSTSAAALSGMFTVPIAYVFLVFVLLYPPCVAAISTVRSELGGRYAAAVFALQVTVAWIIAFVVHTVFLLAGLL